MGKVGLVDRHDDTRKIRWVTEPLTLKELGYKIWFIFFCRTSVFLMGILIFVIDWAHTGYTHVSVWTMFAVIGLSWCFAMLLMGSWQEKYEIRYKRLRYYKKLPVQTRLITE